jgi:hypothetical protein
MAGFNVTNILSGILAAAQGAGAGNWTQAFSGAGSVLTGGATTPVNNAGAIGNAQTGAWQSGVLSTQDQMNKDNAYFNLAMQAQSSDYDNMMSERSELMRESNTLRDVAMEQRKADNKITNDFIKSIG